MKNNQNLPKGWRKVKLGEIIEGIVDNRGKTPSLSKSGYPLIEVFALSRERRYPNVNNDKKQKYVSEEIYNNWFRSGHPREGDILVSTVGTVAQWNLVPPNLKCCIAQNIVALRPNINKVIPEFLFNHFRQRDFIKKVEGIVIGASQPSVKLPHFLDLDVSLPPLAEQKRIASILSAFDDKIELNNKINQTLEQMAQEIFKEWLSKNQKSKIKSQKLDEFVDIISGYPFSSKLYTSDKKAFGVVTIKNVQDGNFITTCDSFIKEEDIPQNMNQECILKNGDILLSLTGNVGRVCFVYGGKYLLNQRVSKLKPKNEKDRAFCYFLFRQKSMQNRLINMAKGSAQPNLSPIETGKIELPIPSRKVLDKLSKLITPIYEQLIRNKEENQKLAALRDLLLPKLMNGEIRV